jgi:hypothetical protein
MAVPVNWNVCPNYNDGKINMPADLVRSATNQWLTVYYF